MASSYTQEEFMPGTGIVVFKLDITADADDASIDDITFNTSLIDYLVKNGYYFARMVTIPSGVTAPTDNYDVTLEDANGRDLLAGTGLNRDEANTEEASPPSFEPIQSTTLVLKVDEQDENAVNSANIKVELHFAKG
jgi:hypothetical protein